MYFFIIFGSLIGAFLCCLSGDACWDQIVALKNRVMGYQAIPIPPPPLLLLPLPALPLQIEDNSVAEETPSNSNNTPDYELIEPPSPLSDESPSPFN